MKQKLIYLFIFILGIGVGYLFNLLFDTSDKIKTPPPIVVKKVKTEIVKDTVFIQKPNTESLSDINYITDTLEYTDEDSLNFEEDNSFNTSPEELQEIIFKDELISQRTITVGIPEVDSTDVALLLNMKSNSYSDDIIVEFWQSPLNLTGYELSRNKLKLFGFNPNESISLQIEDNEDQLILNTETMSLLLQKTKQFKPLKLK